jgi:hypothetical protein
MDFSPDMTVELKNWSSALNEYSSQKLSSTLTGKFSFGNGVRL